MLLQEYRNEVEIKADREGAPSDGDGHTALDYCPWQWVRQSGGRDKGWKRSD